MNTKLKKMLATVKKAAIDVLEDLYLNEEQEKELKLRRVFTEETLLLHKKFEVKDIQTLFAFDKKSGTTFMLVQVDEPHNKRFVWRKTNIAGFYVCEEKLFPSVEAAVKEMMDPDNWACEFYVLDVC